MDKALITQLGDELYEALVKRETVTPLSERFPEITIEDAYQIQQQMIARRLAAGRHGVQRR